MNPDSALPEIPDGLGQPLIHHLPGRMLGTAGLALIGLGLYIIALSLWLQTPVAVPFALLFLMPGSILAFTFLGDTAYIACQHGLVFPRTRGAQACRWDDIKAIWLTTTTQFSSGLAFGKYHSCEIMRRDGRRFKLKYLNKDLAKWIGQKAYACLTQKALEQWAAGRPISFGAVRLSPEGIHTGAEVVPWEEIQSVEPMDDEIVIRRKGRWSAWRRLKNPPNVSLFFFLAELKLKPEPG